MQWYAGTRSRQADGSKLERPNRKAGSMAPKMTTASSSEDEKEDQEQDQDWRAEDAGAEASEPAALDKDSGPKKRKKVTFADSVPAAGPDGAKGKGKMSGQISAAATDQPSGMGPAKHFLLPGATSPQRALPHLAYLGCILSPGFTTSISASLAELLCPCPSSQSAPLFSPLPFRHNITLSY